MTIENLSFNPGELKNSKGYSNNFVKFERFRIGNDGPQYYRILPPFGTNHNGALFHRYDIHWGFTGNNGKMKPVSCSWPTDKTCPVCNKVKESIALRTRLAENGASEEQLQEHSDFIMKFQRQTLFCYNAVSTDGKVGILELKSTGHNNLIQKITEATNPSEGRTPFDPISIDSGIWFKFSKGSKATGWYPVEFKKIFKVLDGNEVEINDRTKLADMMAETYSKIKNQLDKKEPNGPLVDIHTLYAPKTAAELAEILATGVVGGNKQEAQDIQEEEDVGYTHPVTSMREEASTPTTVATSVPLVNTSQVEVKATPVKVVEATVSQPTQLATKSPTQSEPTPSEDMKNKIANDIARLKEMSKKFANKG